MSSPGIANESFTYSGSVLLANITYNTTSPGGNSPTRVGIHAAQYATRVSAGATTTCNRTVGNISGGRGLKSW